MPLLDTLEAQWAANKIDKKADALNPESDNDKEAKTLQTIYNNVNNWCKTMQPKFKAIEDFYHKHYHDKDASFNNPVPPEMEYECMACDSSKEKNYVKACDAYVDKFFKPESGLIRDCLTMIRQLSFIGRYDELGGGAAVNATGDINDKLDPLFHNGGTCAYIYHDDDLNKIVLWLVSRCLWRAEKLLRDNRKNYKMVVPVIRVYLGAAKQNCLLGNEVDIEKNRDMYDIVYNAWEHYYFDLVEKHDWSQLANIPAILGIARQYELLGGGEIDNGELIPKIMKILNSFELNIEMDVKAGKDGGYILSHLKGKAKIAPEFRYGKDSCYEWVVVEDKPDELGQPVKKVNQKIELDLLDNEIITPKYRPTYTGTKKYYTTLQQLKMDYCHPGKDTILITGFIPEPNPMAGTWVYPHDPHPVPSGINSQDHYFQDISKMKQLALSGEAQQHADMAKEQAEKLAAQMKKLSQEIGNKRDPASIAKYQELINKVNSSQQLFNDQSLAPMIYIDFPLQVQNNNYILFKKRFDAKEINPEISSVIEHGYFTVDIEYHSKH